MNTETQTMHARVSLSGDRAASMRPLSLGGKLTWSVGAVADNILQNGLLILYLQIYTIGLGLSAVWLGWALAIPRLLDALIDPWIGNLSDNTRSRWGRRRPYIASGILVGALAFALIWMPPLSWSKPGQFGFFFGCTMLYFLGYAFFYITYTALGMELSDDPAERTRLQGLRLLFASLIGLAFPWLYKLSLVWGAGHEGAPYPKEVYGVRFVGLVMGAVILVTGLIPALFCRESDKGQHQPKIRIGPALRMTVTCRPFLMLAAIVFCVLIGTYIIVPVGTYITIYHVCGGNKDLAALIGGFGGTIFSVVGIAVSPLVAALSVRWGKRRTLCLGIAIMAVGYLATWFCYTPAHPYWLLIPQPLQCTGVICVWVMAPSILADICDFDELACGLRREGMFGAVFALVIKASIAATSILGGYLLLLTGTREGVDPSAGALLIMRVLYITFPGVLLLLAIFLAARFPITEQAVLEMKARLAARRAMLGKAEENYGTT